MNNTVDAHADMASINYRLLLLATVAALVGSMTSCLNSPLLQCVDGSNCAAPSRCAKPTTVTPTSPYLCATPAAIADCTMAAMAGDACGDTGAACVDTDQGLVCVNTVCGDGIVSGSEACDDGNIVDLDKCSRDCLSTEVCGNGVIDRIAGEECDDDVIVGLSNDGCSSTCKVEFRRWRDVSPQPIAGRSSHAMAYDEARKLVVLFGGLKVGSDNTNETWLLDDGHWRRYKGESPPALANAAMAYDSIRKKIVLFGGSTSELTTDAKDQTWEFDVQGWQKRTPALSPRPQTNHVMAFDKSRGEIVLFGIDGETWEYDGLQWKKSLASGPAGRFNAAIAYDEITKQIVMFGGSVSGVANNETWEFDGARWQNKTIVGSPDSRSRHAMYFDSATNRIVLHGGSKSQGSLSDTWVYDGAQWISVSTGGSVPPAADQAVMVFARVSGSGVLLASDAETWLFSAGSIEWTQLRRELSPVAPNPSSTFDQARGVWVLFDSVNAQTWEFDGASWRLRTVQHSPVAPLEPAMAYNPRQAKTILVENNAIASLWQYDGNDWTTLPACTGTCPSAAQVTDARMVFDESRGVFIVVGGYSSRFGSMGTAWELDTVAVPPRWSPLTKLPVAVRSPLLVFDSIRNKTIMLSGLSGSQTMDDIRNYDMFTLEGPADSPGWMSAGRLEFFPLAAAFDEKLQRIVAFSSNGETWELRSASDLSGWEKVDIDIAPAAAASVAQYDPVRQRTMLFFSGMQPSTWSYSLAAQVAQPELCIAGLDTDGDNLIACGDGVHPNTADPDCFGRCYPTCALSSAIQSEPCDSAPGYAHCGDGVCNPSFEDEFLCPTDCR
jgi:cysteine-rich repeat protein